MDRFKQHMEYKAYEEKKIVSERQRREIKRLEERICELELLINALRANSGE